jgi:3-dehydroquinate synthase
MKHLHVKVLSGESVVAVGESIERLKSYSNARKAVIVTDGTVQRLHGHRFPSWSAILVGVGEESKTLETVERIYEAFLGCELDRSALVVAVGGGIVCDVAGFAASTYLRGLRFGFVPTTLLAQVDASVGGKNGVNFQGYKNLIGTFSQPDFVLCDFDLLNTLPEGELNNGFAEVVKQAAIGDAKLFSFLETAWHEALSLDPPVIERIVCDCLKIKTGIVSRDEREKGERRKLNFGHTLGHAIEKAHHLRHGEAISVGMVAAARLSAARRFLSEADVGRLEALLANFGLPVRTPADADLVRDALRKDKKREDEAIHFVLLDGIGNARVVPIGVDELDKVIDDLRQPG